MRDYPKLLGLLCSCVLAYGLYRYGVFDTLGGRLNGYGYLSLFVAGMLFAFGFTAPFAVAVFVEMAGTVHPVPAAIVAGAGAFLTDMSIFKFVRFTFVDELHRLKATRVMQWLHALLHRETISEQTRMYLLWSVAGLMIASPLPDEIGVTLVSGVTIIDPRKFGLLCFTLNTAGIFVILMAAGLAG
jgi:hypothetical protein